jgi:hypothetical protein
MPDDAVFCPECGAEMKPEMALGAPKSPPTGKIVVGVGVAIATIVVVMLIMAHPPRGELPGAPRLLVTGPAAQGMPILDEGTTAVWAWYSNGSKIGTVTYEGVGGNRIDMRGSYTMMFMEYDAQGYALVDPDFGLTQMHLEMESGEITVIMDITVDYARNEMEMEVTTGGISTSSVITFPPEALQPLKVEELYVGWSREYTFQINGITFTMTERVVRQEDITVPKGTFSDCYVIEYSSSTQYGYPGVQFTYWVTPEGYTPQYTVSMMGTEITCKLESYYS